MSNEDLYTSKLFFKDFLKIEDIDVGSNNFNQTFKSLFEGFKSTIGKGKLNNIPNSDNVVITLGNPSEKQNHTRVHKRIHQGFTAGFCRRFRKGFATGVTKDAQKGCTEEFTQGFTQGSLVW